MGTKLKVTLAYPITDGEKLTIRAAANAEDVDGLRVYYRTSGDNATTTHKDFTFVDGNGRALTGKPIFSQGAYITVALDTTNNRAYVHNQAGDLESVELDTSVELGQFQTSAMPSTGVWNRAVFGGGVFVAVQYSPANKMAAYSMDGINWIATSLSNTAATSRWDAIAYGPLNAHVRFLTLAFNNQRGAYSADGIVWTPTTPPANAPWHDLTFGNNRFVAVAGAWDATTMDPMPSDAVAVATNPDTGYEPQWTAATMPSSQVWQGVAFGKGKFVAVAGTNGKAAYSTDGINWTEVSMPSTAAWYSVAFGNGKFIAVAPNGAVAYSTDGITWTAATTLTGTSWSWVTFGNGLFAIAGNGKMAYSEDGSTWQTMNMPGTEARWSGVVFGYDLCVAFKTGATSGDGTNVAGYSTMNYVSHFLNQLVAAVKKFPGKWQRVLGIAASASVTVSQSTAEPNDPNDWS